MSTRTNRRHGGRRRGRTTGRMIFRTLFIGGVSLAAAGWLLAHNGEDHGDAAPAPAATRAQAGGGIVVPKEQQFALGMLTEPVTSHEMARSTVVTGRVVPRTEAVADVVAPIAGKVTGGRIPRLGDRVRKGELLFRVAQVLTPTERAALRTESIRARAELASAEREVSRVERLEGVVAGKQIVEAKIRRDAARDAYNAINAQLDGEGGTVAVTAPISGVITKAEIASGEIVDGSRPLYTIADLSKVWVEADLFEADLPRVEGAVDAAIATPSFPGATFAGRLYRTGSTVDPETRTITALFVVDNPGERLKLNMSVSVALGTGERSRALAVPRSAVVENGGRRRVFVHTAPEEFEPRDIVLGGASEGGYVEIRSGVKEGDRVVTSGSYQLGAMR